MTKFPSAIEDGWWRKRMGLKMSEKRSITRETVRRYKAADRKGKQRILDEFTQTTGYNRKYAIHLLSTWGKEQLHMVDGKPVKFIVGKPGRRKKRTGRRIYDEPVIECCLPAVDSDSMQTCQKILR